MEIALQRNFMNMMERGSQEGRRVQGKVCVHAGTHVCQGMVTVSVLILVELNSSREIILREEVSGDTRLRRDRLDKALNEAIEVWVNSVGERFDFEAAFTS